MHAIKSPYMTFLSNGLIHLPFEVESELESSKSTIFHVSKRRKRASTGKNFVRPLLWQRHDNHTFPLIVGFLCHKETNTPNILGILNKSLITFSIGTA